MPAHPLTPVHLFELVLLLMAVVLPLELLARRLHLPPAAAFIAGGMLLALLPGQHDVQLDPALTLVLFLPPLLLSSAYFTAWRDFRANLRNILQLAVGAVVFTTFAVGLVARWVAPGLPWAACFALGAIVSPPDAVAAKAVLQRVTMPPRMTVVLEGESLVNDATGLVLYRLAVAAALTGTFSAGDAVLSFAALSVGGLLVGAAFGYVVTVLLARLQAMYLTIIGSLLASWAAYIGAEAVGVSGVLSTVAAGLVMSARSHETVSAYVRTSGQAVWRVATFVLESLVFILIGLSLRSIAERTGGNWPAIRALVLPVLAILAAVVLSRFVYIFPAVYLPRLVSARLRERDPSPPLAIPLVIGWAGMRGVVSLAAALALPVNMPGRDFILVASFAVILVTVLGQGATLAPLIGWLKLGRIKVPQSETMREAEARARMAQAQLAAVQHRASAEDGSERHPRLLEQYRYRALASERYSAAESDFAGAKDEHFGVVLAAIAAGRAEVLRMHREGVIHDTVLQSLEQELDLEEVAARRRRGETME